MENWRGEKKTRKQKQNCSQTRPSEDLEQWVCSLLVVCRKGIAESSRDSRHGVGHRESPVRIQRSDENRNIYCEILLHCEQERTPQRRGGGQQASTQREEQCVVAPTCGPESWEGGAEDPLSPEAWTSLNNVAKPYLKTNKSETLGFLNCSTGD